MVSLKTSYWIRGAAVLIPALLILLLVSASTAPAWQAEAAWVPDGDTFILEDRRVIRLQGIDAPETGQGQEKDQYFALESARRLESLIMDRQLDIRPAHQGQDRFKRTLATVYAGGGESVNFKMIRQGYAFYYPHKDLSEELAEKLLRAQRQAMQQRLGFWPVILELEPAPVLYGNLKSKRFHVPGCRYGQRMAESNKVEFSSLFQAFFKGYAPCRKCTPWPAAR
ncbi:MAG: thermonuclease family protein [Desulfonatronovibrionaceae bacterium]